MCLYPKLIQNPKYKKNKKNGGYIPQARDERTLFVPIGCGICMECKNKRKREWVVRLNEELRNNKEKAYFVTLTFNNESYKKLYEEVKQEGYNADNKIATLAMRRFLERRRKKEKKSLRHWAVTELGGGRYEHLHMHAIIWSNKGSEEIIKHWKYGYVYIGTHVDEGTINYITKYMQKIDEKHPNYKGIVLTSKGIGKGYIQREDSKRNKYKEQETKETYKTRKGLELALPIYYRNNIYSEEEREKLWIEKLNKEERWVCGERIKVDSKKGEEEYNKTREYYRQKSKRLGYGKPSEWKDQEYENERRKLIQAKRINDT
jgi:hypothetical protein